MQVECNKKWGWTAEHTLALIQGLYEKKLTTYPRVDTTYLSDDIHSKIAPTLRQMTPYASVTAPILANPIPKSKKIFDNSKVTDHHAIIPTGQYPSGLDGDEKKLYHLIAMRFIGVFYPDCQFESTTVIGEAGKEEFKATGKVIVSPGWRALFQDKPNPTRLLKNRLYRFLSKAKAARIFLRLPKRLRSRPNITRMVLCCGRWKPPAVQ